MERSQEEAEERVGFVDILFYHIIYIHMEQLIVIGGAELFDTKEDYYRFLSEYPLDINKKSLWSRKDRIIQACSWKMKCLKIDMPNKQDADYKSWKIWFNKHLELVDTKDLILVWNSLWSTFLIKYLSENNIDGHISQLHLACPMFNGKCLYPTYAGTKDFDINENLLNNISSQVWDIHIYHSKDDSCVPYSHSERLVEKLSIAKLHTFQDRDHFLQPAFPELLNNIGIYTR